MFAKGRTERRPRATGYFARGRMGRLSPNSFARPGNEALFAPKHLTTLDFIETKRKEIWKGYVGGNSPFLSIKIVTETEMVLRCVVLRSVVYTTRYDD